jgi:hypothetical protein
LRKKFTIETIFDPLSRVLGNNNRSNRLADNRKSTALSQW